MHHFQFQSVIILFVGTILLYLQTQYADFIFEKSLPFVFCNNSQPLSMNKIAPRQRYNREDMNKAIDTLRLGKIVLFPTELEWVVACDATNSEAVENLLKLESYFDNKIPTLLIDHPAKLNTYLNFVPDVAWDLIDFSEKPTTILFEGARNLADLLMLRKQIAFRETNGSFARDLCTRFRNPIYTAPINTDCFDLLKKSVGITVEYEDEQPQFNKSHVIIQIGAGNLFKIIRD